MHEEVYIDQEVMDRISLAVRWVEAQQKKDGNKEPLERTSSRPVVVVKIQSTTTIGPNRYAGKTYNLSNSEDRTATPLFVEAEGEDVDVISALADTPVADQLYLGVVIGHVPDVPIPVVVIWKAVTTSVGGMDAVVATITGTKTTGTGSELAYYPATHAYAALGGPWTTGEVIRVVNIGITKLQVGQAYVAAYIGTTSGGVNVYAARDDSATCSGGFFVQDLET